MLIKAEGLHGVALHGMALRGVTLRDVTLHGVAWCYIACHSVE